MEKKQLKKYLILAVIAVGVCLVVKYTESIGQMLLAVFASIYPLIIGAAVAFVFDIFLSFCEKWYFPKKTEGALAASRRPVCLIISLAVMVGFIALIIKIVVPELGNAVTIISKEIPGALKNLKDFAVKELNDYPEIQQNIKSIKIDWDSLIDDVITFVKGGAGGFITSVAGIIGSVTTSIFNWVVGLIFALYLLLRKSRLRSDASRMRNAYLSENTSKKLTHIYKTTVDIFQKFFVGQFAEAIILGLLCMIGMKILKLPYAAMTGTVIGVMALLPIVGAYIGAAVGAFMICTVDPMKAVVFLIFLVLLQQFEGNVIYPKVVGNSVGLPGIWVLAAVTIGGGLFGIMGMLLGVPTFAVIYKLLHEELEIKEREKGIAIPTQEPANRPQNAHKFSFREFISRFKIRRR